MGRSPRVPKRHAALARSVRAGREQLADLLSAEAFENYDDKGTTAESIFAEIIARQLDAMRQLGFDYRSGLLFAVLRFTGWNPETRDDMRDLIELALRIGEAEETHNRRIPNRRTVTK